MPRSAAKNLWTRSWANADHLSGWPARIAGHDLALRRKAEALIFELRTAIADHCQRRADELERDERK
jgi:hypothetical protein